MCIRDSLQVPARVPEVALGAVDKVLEDLGLLQDGERQPNPALERLLGLQGLGGV